MFANLKNKLIEEVKASPSKFQQFANAAQAAVSSSTSTTPNSSETNTTGTNDNFFSITEEDTPQNSPYRLQKLPAASTSALRGRSSTQSLNGVGGGAVPRTRKLSNSSMASDVSFRLPTYDAPSMYHLQSDLDETSSEFDDSASTARLDVITKDQLYDAYKKSLDRYHKYRCRYTDLAKKYKELERDSTKARSVLVETQEKALRRISELREQCTLEQQAKAHLEEALRIEMDDMSCKMQAYQTKLKLLGENPDNIEAALERGPAADSEQLIDLAESTPNGTSTCDSQPMQDDDLLRLQELLKESENQLQQMTEKHDTAISTIATLRKQEEENVLLLAQTKQAIHTELEHKEREVKQLQDKLKKLEGDNDTKEQVKKLQNAKQEADAKVIATEHLLSTLRSDFTSKEQQVATLEGQLQTLKTASEQTIQDLSQHNGQLNEMLQRYQQNELTLAEVDGQLKQAKQEIASLQQKLKQQDQKIVDAEKSLEIERDVVAALNAEKSTFDELRSNYDQQLLKVDQLQRELQILKEQHTSNESETIAALKLELERTNETLNEQLSTAKSNLASKEKELKANSNKFNKLKKQQEQTQTKLNEHNAEVKRLNSQLAQQEERLRQAAQVESEKEELQTRVAAILDEITTMQAHLQEVQQSHAELEREKGKLESKIEQLQQQQLENSVQSGASNERAKRFEAQLEEIERENTKLSERNCLLEEQNNHLQKQLEERQRQQTTENEALVSELRLQLQTAQDDLAKLETKMKQVLDDHSRMQNAQEIMDHDHRTLQDKCDAYEKEKLLLEDELKCAQLAATDLQQTNTALETELTELRQTAQVSANELAQFESVREALQQQLDALKEVQSNDERHKTLLEQAQQRNTQLQNELIAIGTQLQAIEHYPVELDRVQQELCELREKRHELEQQVQEHKQMAIDLETQLHELQDQSNKQQSTLAEKEASIEAMRTQLDSSSSTQTEEISALQATLQNLRHQLEAQKQVEQALNEKMQAVNAAHVTQLETLEARCGAANSDVERLHEANDALQLELETLKNRYSLQIDELQEILNQRDMQLAGNVEATKKLAAYEQLQIENEYLTMHTKQLEQDLTEAKSLTQTSHTDNSELKDKLKSLQCELYVLQEQVEKHVSELAEKDKHSIAAMEEVIKLKSQLEEQTLELSRQSEHAKFVTEQSDTVQKELLHSQQQVQEKQDEITQLQESRNGLEVQLQKLQAEHTTSTQTLETLHEQITELKTQLAAQPATNGTDAVHLRNINEQLQRELEDLKYKSNGEQANLQQEIDELQGNNNQMAERIMELETLRASIQAQQLLASMAPKSVQNSTKSEAIASPDDEKTELEMKLKEIMTEVQDVTNRNLFLEQKCENYLILEQSNERLKSQNAKLSRQLDETLVSMQHSENVPVNTEFEYLRNIMFQYLTGNTNNETLVKVIAAVLKFSPQQQQVALEKEHQRRSLLNKIL
ncbi:myosin-11 [Scaptodrosophila lebanonensis]|uniref:Myosin-11 n=1 Tax=Drosophila lebanonensis TaxID=7225 RepID=A0A6J2T0P7_DROLE|nr:myosin-11 [Scaptodrosophila lebanonensis]